MVAPSLKGLIEGIELTPDEVGDAISHGSDAVYVNADPHDRSPGRSDAAILGQFAVRRLTFHGSKQSRSVISRSVPEIGTAGAIGAN
jgi:hypothetical protein